MRPDAVKNCPFYPHNKEVAQIGLADQIILVYGMGIRQLNGTLFSI